MNAGLTTSASYSHLSSEDVRTDSPTGETYSNRLTGAVRYASPGNRVWLAIPEDPTTIWPKVKQFLADSNPSARA